MSTTQEFPKILQKPIHEANEDWDLEIPEWMRNLRDKPSSQPVAQTTEQIGESCEIGCESCSG